MYFPVGWPKYLKQPLDHVGSCRYVAASCDRMLFAVLTDNSLNIWYCKPSVQIVSYTQSQKNICEFGYFQIAEWKADSTVIAVTTSRNHIVFFKVDLDITVPNHHSLYVQKEARSRQKTQESNGTPDAESVPAIKLTVLNNIKLNEEISCFLSVREELVISSKEYTVSRLKWNGSKVNKGTWHLHDIPVSADLQHSRATKLTEVDGYVTQLDYSPVLGGYIFVLSSGKAVFVIPPSARSDEGIQGVWARELVDATCTAVNHRYRLMAFGGKSGEGLVYMIDEVTGALEISHKLIVSCKDYPDAAQTAGCVKCMKWTPDGSALSLCWENGGFSVWSVFGSLLLCTLGGDDWFSNAGPSQYPHPITSLEWGLEGYHLWMVSSPKDDNIDNNSYKSKFLVQLQFVKSALSVNPCMANHEHLFLQGEDKLYMCVIDNISSQSPHYKSSIHMMIGAHITIGNKQWHIIPISHSYLASNWPIRYTSVDRAGQCIAIAGKTGLAHYAMFTRKWKLFGNETQEKDLVVSGGMTWWKDFICAACYNILYQKDEIRFYPRSSKLDNTFAQVTKVPSQVLLLNAFGDILIVFCADSHVMLFNLERKNTQTNPTVNITKIQEVSFNDFVPHPISVTGLALTSLRTEAGSKSQTNSKEVESILLNVAGKLLMFQRDRSGPQIKEQDHKYRAVPFCTPSVVATSVENMWTTSRANTGKVQLMEALWLGCGTLGMKVWLPLFPRGGDKTHNFMSKRIMLPFRVDIYPLAVLFEDAVILGAACDTVCCEGASLSRDQSSTHQYLPYCTVEKTSQIYLHHILRQLLRRNLGVHALDLARSCTELPYFRHVLELLLHEVLEAEATSKEPIPDPLLPRVVAFIQEFPEYLHSVVHCARKTEVALWPYLFATVGKPKDLFEECLINEELETAASYLIILQNLEKPMVSRQHATLLLDSSLEKCNFELSRDLVRFLKAIDPSDAELPPHLTLNKVTPSSKYSTGFPSPPLNKGDGNAFSYSSVSNVGRVRSASVSAGEALQEVTKPKEKVKATVSDAQAIQNKSRHNSKSSKEEYSPDMVYIDAILCRHARKLLTSNQIRHLGAFASNIEDFHLVAWLKRERVRAAKVDDFVSALRDLHHQFEWPLPVLSSNTFHQLKKSWATSSSSLASSSLLDEDNSNSSGTCDRQPLSPECDSSTFISSLAHVKPLPQDSTSYSDEIILKPQLLRGEESSNTTIDVSDSSSIVAEFDTLPDIANNGDMGPVDLELLSQEVANKGPMQSELELRYLLQIMLEAGCLEWAVIIAIVLRDTLGVVRTVNTASMTDTQLEVVARMREGLSFLELWADTECIGYKVFFHKIRTQIKVLKKIVEQAPPSIQINTSFSSEVSCEELSLSPVAQTIHTENEQKQCEELVSSVEEKKPSECAVS